jgi:hypothetical protein
VSGAGGIIERMFDMAVRPGIPASLDEVEPGPALAGWMSSLDVHRVSGADRVTVLRAYRRLASHFAALAYEAMEAVVEEFEEEDGDLAAAVEAAAAEIRAALRLTRRGADGELFFALELRRRLPQVWDLLVRGVIDLRRARVVAHGTGHLPDATARSVVAEVAGVAGRLTTGQLAARIRRLCLAVDPDEGRRRYQQAVAERRVVSEPTPAGSVNLLGLDLPAGRAAAVMRRVGVLARHLKVKGETRTMDQLRADVFLDLLDGSAEGDGSGAVGVVRGSVDLQVDLATLAGLSEAPGEVAGIGPVIADVARQVAALQAGATWRYTVIDPASGQVVQTGVTRRRPTADQRRVVEARHRTCVFPGCRMPATECDLDHQVMWSEGGATCVENLVPLCRHDHRLRHLGGWSHETLPEGDHRWVSRLGHVYASSGRSP